MSRFAVILFNLGGPDSLKAVQPFLEYLFNDPDIFKLPFQKQFAKYLSKKRAPKIEKEYNLIGGKSPIGYWTELQRQMLEKNLCKKNDVQVFTAMRYWNPLTEETSKIVSTKKFNKILLLPLYPHYSISTTGSSFNEWKRHYKNSTEEIFVDEYCEHPIYLQAVNKRINEALEKFPIEKKERVELVFSAHGTPISYVKKGDPYSSHIKKTVEGIMKLRNHSQKYSLCYQSKVGPMKWLGPATDEMIKSLSERGTKNLLIIPISFVSDHIETLFELDIEYRHVADECGIENYIVMKGLNDSPIFIDALTDIAIKKLDLQN